jgi:ABC-type uncharacterized transport system substrate-binding protein
MRTALARIALLLALWLTQVGLLQAHPHVFVKVRADLMTRDGALVGLRYTWIFDRTWLESQLLEHDKDNDGKLSREELRPLEDESRQTLEMFRSFTAIRAAGTLIRLATPGDVVVDYRGDVLGLSFTAMLPKPLPLAGNEILLETYDATFFSSFAPDGSDAVRFAGDPPPACTIHVGVPASPQQMNAWRLIRKQMGPEWVDTGGTPTSTSIRCAKPAQQSGSEPMALHKPALMR